MKIHFVGHAALLVTFKDSKILIDPVLNWLGSLLLVNNISNNNGNIDELSFNEIEIGTMLNNLDAVLYTNPFVEKIESKSFRIFANKIPILCQPKDEVFFNNLGFRCVSSISEEYEIKSLKIHRPEITTKKFFWLKELSYGFLLKSSDEPTIYLTGSAPYDTRLKKIIKSEQPDLIIFNNLSKSKTKNEKLTTGFISELQKEISDLMLFGMNMETGTHFLMSKNNLEINLKDSLCSIQFL
jgi:L-ascorbate metabolism protein UlaG (beta-lactamase superfamily)